MNKMNIYEDMIPAYLSGKISLEDCEAFESELKISKDLRDSLNKSKHIYIGLKVSDKISDGHIDSQTLAEYSLNQDDFDDTSKSEIIEHLKTCEQCSDELHFCQPVKAPIMEKENFLKKIFSWFFSPQFNLRPIYGVAIIVLMIAPMLQFGVPFLHNSNNSAKYRLNALGHRDELKTENIITINQNQQIIQFEFNVEYIAEDLYNFEIHNDKNEILFSKYSNTPNEPFVYSIPVSELSPGNYTLIVKEFENGKATGVQFRFPLELMIAK